MMSGHPQERRRECSESDPGSAQSAYRLFRAPVFCLVGALATAFVVPWPDMDPAARRSLFVLVLAASLWITDAVPAYAVALLIMGLQVALLGVPGGVFAETAEDWEMFVRSWASPLLWLFFGGFVLARAAVKTGLDRRIALMTLTRVRPRPGRILGVVMTVTFFSSMFMSNTATAAMMVAMMTPVVRTLDRSDPYGKGLLLGVAFAASLGGMGTIIGSPPNAIAAAALGDSTSVSFIGWMGAGLPVAIPLAALVWVYLRLRYPSNHEEIDFSALRGEPGRDADVPARHAVYVGLVFVVTIGLWLTSALHGVPATVTVFLPIMALSAGGILTSQDIRKLPWDILLLLAGGLSLGVGIRETGLAEWQVERMPLGGLPLFLTGLFFAYAACWLSNVMSNTAAANVLVPLGVAFAAGSGEAVVSVSIALAASAALLLPISTPPNAIAYSHDRIVTRDFLAVGLLVALVAPPLIAGWTLLYFG